MVRALARLHGRFWESARFGRDLAWLGARDGDRIRRIGRFLSAIAVPAALRRFGELVPPELHAAAGRIGATRERLDAAWSESPLTLVHGDRTRGTCTSSTTPSGSSTGRMNSARDHVARRGGA